MKFYEMLDVYNFIKKELNPEQTEAYKEYTNKMDALFKELSPYFPADKKSVYPPIKEQDYKRISKVFDEAAVASNNYIQTYKNVIPEFNKNLPPIQDVAINLNNEFFSKAYVEFKNIKPNPHFSLKDQMEDFRYTNVEITSDELKKLGAAQSSRIKMSVDIDGKEVQGVFTNMTNLEGKKNIEAIFPRMIEKYPKYASFFKSVDPAKFYDNGATNINLASFYDKKSQPLMGDRAKDALNKFLTNGKFDKNTLKEANKFLAEDDFYDACVDFTYQVEKYRVGIGMNKNVMGMKDGDRIDSKNSAMSAVANLIGCPDLIAKSRPLVIYDDKGNKYQEGTFMEFVNGKDINNLDPVDEMRLMKPSDFESPEIKQQLANLQVLDYICGNVDRHSANILYQVDPKTRKLTKITGIDNDSAFFKRDLNENNKLIRLPGINYLRVIDEDMAETIKNLDEGQLKATLHGFGLDKAAVDAAWNRTVQLKNVINNGHQYEENNMVLPPNPQNPTITIMKKEDWGKVHLINCHQGIENYFTQMEGVAQTMSYNEEVFPHNIQNKTSAIKGLKSSMGKSQSSYLLKKAKEASPWFFTSNRYKNILNKLKEYDETPIVGDNPLSKDNEKKFVKLYEMKHAIDVYKMEKMSDGLIDENWNVIKGLSGKDLERVLSVKNLETYVNRVEAERQSAAEAKQVYDEQKKKVEKANDFLKKKDEDKKFLVNKKLEEEAKKQQEKENLIVTSKVSHDVNSNNIINENNFIKPDEVEINKDIQIDKEEVKENIIIDLDNEKEM